MVYVVERYLPGLSREEVEQALSGLEQTMPEVGPEDVRVRYLGSTIVPDDESCFCHFEASSEEAVAEANRRAGIPFDRIVEGVAVAPAPRGNEGR